MICSGATIASDFGAKATSYTKAAELAGIHPNTATLCSVFFYDTGLVAKADGALASPEVVAFARAYEWDQDAAAAKLGPAIRRSWFGSTLATRLKMRPLAEEEALRILGEEAHASPEHRPQLKMCIEYLEAARVVARSGDQLRLLDAVAEESPAPQAPPAAEADDHPAERVTSSAPRDADRPEARRRGFGSVPPATGLDGGIRFDCSINITMADMARLSPEQLKELFAGLATLVAAQNALSG